MDRMSESELSSAVIGPDTANKAVRRAIGNRDGFFLSVERQDDLHRTEDFFLRQTMIGRNIADQGR
ncbi:hypothetical protein D3C79_1082870 [compost metagenome]